MVVQAATEYYPLPFYAKNKDNEEIYAVKRNKDQFYLNIDGKEIFALKKNSANQFVPYFAKTHTGIPICPILEVGQKFLKEKIDYLRNSNKREIYPMRDSHEFYIMPDNTSIYAKDENASEYYAVNKNKKAYYGGRLTDDGHLIEIPAKDHKLKSIYIEENDTILYPIDHFKNAPIYPMDENKNNFYIEKNNVQIYGKNKQKLPFYAKKSFGDEFFATKNGIDYYASYEAENNHVEYYPKMKNKRQFYLKIGKKEIYAKHNNNEKYAKNEKKDDILAENDNIPYYAANNNTIEIYPSYVSGRNFYKVINAKEMIAINKANNIGYYAKDEFNNSFYPKDFNPPVELDEPKVEMPQTITEPTLQEILEHEA